MKRLSDMLHFEKLNIAVKFTAFLLLILAGLICMPKSGTMAAEYVKYQDNGTILLEYNNTSDKQTLLLIDHDETYAKKESNRYSYKIQKGKNKLVFPLSEGYGTYTVRIGVDNGVNYSVVYKTTVEFNEDDKEETFCVSSAQIRYKLTDKAARKAKSLRKKNKKDTDFYTAVYNYVIKNYMYDYDNLAEKTKSGSYYVPDIKVVYRTKLGICCDISCLAAAMLRSQGVKTRMVYGYSTKVSGYHAWNQIYSEQDDEWYTVDMTYDMCKYGKGIKVDMIKDFDDYSDISYTY